MRTLSQQEMRQLDEFLYSPFFNKNQTIQSLFEILKQYYPLFESPEIERTKLFKSIYGDESYEEQKLRYLMTDLTKHIEEYLCYKAINGEELFKMHLLLYTYRMRKLEKPFYSTIKVAEKMLIDWPRRDVSHAFYEYLIEEDKYKFESDRKEHLLKTNLQKVVNDLDKYYILNKMRYSAEIINNKNVVALNYHLFLYEEIMNHLRNNPLNNVPAAKIYYYVILTLNEPENIQHYRNLLNGLDEHKNIFGKDELFDLYVYAKNFCVRKINQGYTEYIKELFELYKIILTNKIIFKDGGLSQFDYKNIVYLGLRVNELDWVQNFIIKYNDFLDAKLRKNAYTYNMASYHYFMNNFDEALTLLRSVEFSDIYYHLDSKSLLLKIYYEQEASEPFFSLVEAFKVYIKRNALIPASQKNTYYNMIKYVTKLYKWKLNPKKNLKELEDEIESTKPLADINWIRKKIEEGYKIEEKLSGTWRKK